MKKLLLAMAMVLVMVNLANAEPIFCYQKSDGTVKYVESGVCPKSYMPVPLPMGPQGPQGNPGIQGQPGANGVSGYQIVSAESAKDSSRCKYVQVTCGYAYNPATGWWQQTRLLSGSTNWQSHDGNVVIIYEGIQACAGQPSTDYGWTPQGCSGYTYIVLACLGEWVPDGAVWDFHADAICALVN